MQYPFFEPGGVLVAQACAKKPDGSPGHASYMPALSFLPFERRRMRRMLRVHFFDDWCMDLSVKLALQSSLPSEATSSRSRAPGTGASARPSCRSPRSSRTRALTRAEPAPPRRIFERGCLRKYFFSNVDSHHITWYKIDQIEKSI